MALLAVAQPWFAGVAAQATTTVQCEQRRNLCIFDFDHTLKKGCWCVPLQPSSFPSTAPRTLAPTPHPAADDRHTPPHLPRTPCSYHCCGVLPAEAVAAVRECIENNFEIAIASANRNYNFVRDFLGANFPSELTSKLYTEAVQTGQSYKTSSLTAVLRYHGMQRCVRHPSPFAVALSRA